MTDRPAGSDAFEVVFAELSAVIAALEAEETASPRLSDGERQRAAQFAHIEDGRLWRAGRITLRLALERWVGDAIRGGAFVIDASGRPSLAGGRPQFSISHSGDLVLIAISARQSVGVDVEGARLLRMSKDRQLRIIDAARMYASGGEDPARDGAATTHQARVIQSWVRLEAVAKATGAGIGRVLTEAGVVGPTVRRDHAVNQRLDVRDLDLGPGVYGAIAAAALPARVNVRRFPADAAGIAAFMAESAG